tara:strand:+ start:226 stop:462 length:237 start_codon:yes stop_codon:yes gene_type:complete
MIEYKNATKEELLKIVEILLRVINTVNYTLAFDVMRTEAALMEEISAADPWDEAENYMLSDDEIIKIINKESEAVNEK